jgi:hypothetical protein
VGVSHGAPSGLVATIGFLLAAILCASLLVALSGGAA